MNKLVVLLILVTLAAASPPEATAQKSGKAPKDTLCIASSGTSNQVIINSENATHLNECTDSLAVKGKIVQQGQNNSIQINTKNEVPSNKKPKNQNTVIIRQNGKNNSVKINSR